MGRVPLPRSSPGLPRRPGAGEVVGGWFRGMAGRRWRVIGFVLGWLAAGIVRGASGEVEVTLEVLLAAGPPPKTFCVCAEPSPSGWRGRRFCGRATWSCCNPARRRFSGIRTVAGCGVRASVSKSGANPNWAVCAVCSAGSCFSGRSAESSGTDFWGARAPSSRSISDRPDLDPPARGGAIARERGGTATPGAGTRRPANPGGLGQFQRTAPYRGGHGIHPVVALLPGRAGRRRAAPDRGGTIRTGGFAVAYRTGDVATAIRAAGPVEPRSEGGRIYRAALHLAGGHPDRARAELAGVAAPPAETPTASLVRALELVLDTVEGSDRVGRSRRPRAPRANGWRDPTNTRRGSISAAPWPPRPRRPGRIRPSAPRRCVGPSSCSTGGGGGRRSGNRPGPGNCARGIPRCTCWPGF